MGPTENSTCIWVWGLEIWVDITFTNITQLSFRQVIIEIPFHYKMKMGRRYALLQLQSSRIFCKQQ